MSAIAPEKLWDPPASLRDRARMTEFLAWLRSERGLELDGYDELWRWSVDDLEGFWSAIWQFFDVQADGDPVTPPEKAASRDSLANPAALD